MSQRILRTVPAALLMTTALAWNLPAAAQGTMGAPVGAATGTVQKAPAPATPAPAADTAPRGGAAFGGGSALPADLTPAMPADLTPAMPASAASGAASAGKPAGMPAPRSTRP